jgi:hypothetical protein
MPRDRNVASQFFQKLIGVDTEGGRFVYAEEYSEKKCNSVFKTHLSDIGVGKMFFNNRLSMHEDLLGATAEDIIGRKDFNFIK